MTDLVSQVRRLRSGKARPATATSGEALFLPIGQQLLEANGGGFYVELPGRSQHDETQS